MIANGYKLGVIAFILAHLCCRQSGVRGSSYNPVVSPDPIWCLVLSMPLSLKPWHAQLRDLLTTNSSPAPGFDGLVSSSRSGCDQVPRTGGFRGRMKPILMSPAGQGKPSQPTPGKGTWSRGIWAPDLETGALFLVLVKDFLRSAQLHITGLGLRGASWPTRLLCILCPFPMNPEGPWTQIWCFTSLVVFDTYSESLKTITLVNSTNCKYYDKV